MRITQVNKIEDCEGQYGPQKRISVNDEFGKQVSGWIPLDKFNPDEWQVGRSPEVDVTQNGKYWNFKLRSKKAQVAVANQEGNDRIINGLTAVYKLLKELNSKVDKMIPAPVPVWKTTDPVPVMEEWDKYEEPKPVSDAYEPPVDPDSVPF